MLVGVAVGFTAWNNFCTTAGVSVPRRVPFAMASISFLEPYLVTIGDQLTSDRARGVGKLRDIVYYCWDCR